jgi:hypothetical protein
MAPPELPAGNFSLVNPARRFLRAITAFPTHYE